MPAALTGDEVVRFLKAVSDLKMRTIFITIYAAGLRVCEAAALTVKDIDSARMVIVVRQGKGRKDRCVMLSEQLLAILRDCWRRGRPSLWLFPGADPSHPVTTRTVQRACREAVEAAGLDKSVTVHTLRRSFATHLLEQGVDIHVVQDLLGHRNIMSTPGTPACDSRLVALTDERVSFRWNDDRANGRSKGKVMTPAAGEFLRRFLMRVLPDGFHRIRHNGLLANGRRIENLALRRERLDVSMLSMDSDGAGNGDQSKAAVEPPPCPSCGGRMRITQSFDSAYSRVRTARGFDSS